MSIVRSLAMKALADVLTPVLPEIEQIVVEDQDPDKQACYPNLVINTQGPFTFDPHDPDELESTVTDVKVHVGDWLGSIRLRLGAKSRAERTDLGDRVTDMFLQDPLRRGVLLVQLRDFAVGGYAFKGPIPVAFRLNAEDWEEEFVFERKRFSNLVVDCELPALVTWAQTYDINTLVLAFTEDLTSATPAIEQVAITTDGDLEVYP